MWKTKTCFQLRSRQDLVSLESGSQENLEVFESYLTMDVSPKQEALANNNTRKKIL